MVQQIRKTPIVVNDSRGFYTSRVIGFFVNEGLAMLAEGVHPISLERAATQAGYPVGTLQLTDELNMELMLKIDKASRGRRRARRHALRRAPRHRRGPEDARGRSRRSRLKGAGFYDYDESGKRGSLWSGLAELFPVAEEQIAVEDIKDRMLFAEALETAKCFEEGVIDLRRRGQHRLDHGHRLPADDRWRGAVHDRLRGRRDGEIGLAAFVARADELAAAYGERFAPTAYLRDLAESGGSFPA